jgi:hypothetical protein
LRLRPKNRVKWGEDVVDNEGMGKRKSNRCCIFHKRKKFGDSSSESEYSSGAESGSDSPRRRGSDRAQHRRKQKCTCDPDEAGEAGQSIAASRRAPFSKRVQEKETEAGSAGVGDTGVDCKKHEAEEAVMFISSSLRLALTPLSLSSDNRAWASEGAVGSMDRPGSSAE